MNDNFVYGLNEKNRNYIVTIVFVALLVFGPVQPYGLVIRFVYLAQSAPSCDFGQVGERFGNVAFGIDDGNHRRGQFAPS